MKRLLLFGLVAGAVISPSAIAADPRPAAHANAAKACKAEQALPEADFRAAHGGKSFAEFYGENKNGKDAYGKCVSAKAQAAAAEQHAKRTNAAKACKAARKANPAAFAGKYGSRPARAFGKCVSKHAKKQ